MKADLTRKKLVKDPRLPRDRSIHKIQQQYSKLEKNISLEIGTSDSYKFETTPGQDNTKKNNRIQCNKKVGRKNNQLKQSISISQKAKRMELEDVPNLGKFVYLPVHLRTTSAMISRSGSVKKCKLDDNIKKRERMIDNLTQFNTSSSQYCSPTKNYKVDHIQIANLQGSASKYDTGSVTNSRGATQSTSKKLERYLSKISSAAKFKGEVLEEKYDFATDLALRCSADSVKNQKRRSSVH